MVLRGAGARSSCATRRRASTWSSTGRARCSCSPQSGRPYRTLPHVVGHAGDADGVRHLPLLPARRRARTRKGMVHSNYFIRGYAIHGYASVPNYPASHGCLRVPIPNAAQIYDWVDIGDQIFLYAVARPGAWRCLATKRPYAATLRTSPRKAVERDSGRLSGPPARSASAGPQGAGRRAPGTRVWPERAPPRSAPPRAGAGAAGAGANRSGRATGAGAGASVGDRLGRRRSDRAAGATGAPAPPRAAPPVRGAAVAGGTPRRSAEPARPERAPLRSAPPPSGAAVVAEAPPRRGAVAAGAGRPQPARRRRLRRHRRPPGIRPAQVGARVLRPGRPRASRSAGGARCSCPCSPRSRSPGPAGPALPGWSANRDRCA